MSEWKFPEGSLVRVKEEFRGFGQTWPAGTQFVIDDYVTGADAGPEDGDHRPFYWGNINGGMNNVWAHEENLELVKSATEMENRRIPTAQEIVKELSVLDHYDGFELFESQNDGTNLDVFGKTDDGLPFGFVIQIRKVERTDF